MGTYDKALQALESYKSKKVLPKKFDKFTGEGVLLSNQLDALSDELQNDIDEAQRQLEEISEFESAWDKLK